MIMDWGIFQMEKEEEDRKDTQQHLIALVKLGDVSDADKDWLPRKQIKAPTKG